MSSPEPTATAAAPAQTAGVAQASVRYLGVPSVARLAMFARHPGPAVLLTTEARLELYSDTHVFGALRSVNPSLPDWHEKRDKVVVSLDHALRAFPQRPELYALELAKGRDYSATICLSAWCASITRASPLVSSSPLERRATRGLGTPSTRWA